MIRRPPAPSLPASLPAFLPAPLPAPPPAFLPDLGLRWGSRVRVLSQEHFLLLSLIVVVTAPIPRLYLSCGSAGWLHLVDADGPVPGSTAASRPLRAVFTTVIRR